MLTEEEWGTYKKMIGKATRKELGKMMDLLELEINLSETAIKEGFEKKK